MKLDKSPVRLDFIDGLRGIAALAVVLSHSIGMVPPDHPVLPIWQADAELLLQWPFLFGKEMVWLFILLSGFALYWSEETRWINGRGATGFSLFLLRRAWRILPTYYVALATGAVVVVGLGAFLLHPSASLNTFEPVTAGGVVSHLVLAHNVKSTWAYQLNPPLWSIAVEAQLYILFPLFFVLRKKLTIYGAAALVVTAVYLANRLLPFAFFSLVELFALGVVLAHIARRRRIAPWVLWAIAATATAVGVARPVLPAKVEEGLWSIAFAAVVLGLVNTPHRWWMIPNWRVTRWLGARSYSLYAIHFPLALLLWAVIGRVGLTRPLEILLIVPSVVAASLLGSSFLWKWVEVPSQSRSKNARVSGR